MLVCIEPVFLDIYFNLYNILLKVDRYILLFLRKSYEVVDNPHLLKHLNKMF